MARITEEASATVTMNMEPARKSFEEWTDAVDKGKKKLEELLAEADRPGKDAAIAKLKDDIAHASNEAEKAGKKLKTFRDTLSNLKAAPFNDLVKASKELESQIKKLTPGTEEYIAATHDLKMVNTRLKDLREGWRAVTDETEKSKSITNKIVEGFQRYWSMFDVGMRTITGVSMKFRQCAEDAAKLDDVYADVMKTTGLLHGEVAELDEELKKIDTRTSREQLLLLARDAGKLGIQGKENILGFVRAADQIQVALGEDLGEGAVKNLGKIADVLGYTKAMGVEKALLSIGSAVNAVGQASTASEGYLVEFTQRMAGVGQLAHLSAANIIGFASGLDQSAMKVEMASTAFQKFMMKLYSEPEKFAKYAKQSVDDFSKLMKTDANAAMIEVLKGLKEIGDMSELTSHFDEMGLDGARTVQVLGAMASNLDAVTVAQALANEEFEKATSIGEEYATKNNNLQAQLEKARKEFHNASITLGQSLNPILLKSTKATTYLIKALANYGKEIKTVLIVIAALTVALKAKVIWQKAVATLNATLRAGSLALAAAQALLTGNVKRATAAWKLMNTAMKASVFGIAIAAVSGLAIWLQRLAQKHREAAEAAQWEQKLEAKATEAYSDEAAKVNTLTRIIDSNNVSLESRRKALEELKKIVPGYHADLTEEGRLINDNREALDQYVDALKKAARVKVRREDIEQREAQIMATEDKLEDAKKREAVATVNYKGDRFEVEGDLITESDEYVELKAATEAREKLEAELEELNKQQKQAVERYNEIAGVIIENAVENAEDVAHATDEATKTANAILTENQFAYLQERQEKLTKKEKKLVEAGYEKLSVEESKVLKARYDKLMKADSNLADKRYQAEVKQLEQAQRAEQNLINQQFFDKQITAEEHEKQLRDITMRYLWEKRKLAEDNGKDVTAIDAVIFTERMKVRKEDYDKALKDLEARQKGEENALALSLAAQEITEKQYQAQMLELKMRYLQEKLELARDNGQDETAILQSILDAQIEAQKAAAEEMAKLRKEAKEVTDGLRSPSEARNTEMQEKLKQLDVLHDAMLLSEQQYEEAVKQLRKKYADEDLKEKLANVQKYAEQVNSVMSEASNFVTQLKEFETAQLEAEYQAQLTAAGDNAEKREQIEAEYEQKQLDLKKKYADTEMAINIAKTVAAGAVAAIKAFSEGGPYLGVALAAMIAATTAAEVATIIAQRNAVKNTSVSSSSGSSSPVTVTPTGYSEGGNTKRAASDSTPVGIVHANEWVAPAWMVRRNPVMFRDLERYRVAGSRGHIGSLDRGFADGGFTGGGSAGSDAMTQKMLAAIDRLEANTAANTAALLRLMDEGVPAYEVYDQRQSFETQRKRFKNATRR
jgi:TP901 family phage tail tape measure protein